MSLEYRIICNCFKTGKFELNQIPYPKYLKKDEDGNFYYDDIEIAKEEKRYFIYDEISDWKKNICEHRKLEGFICNYSSQMTINLILKTLLSAKEFPYIFKCYPFLNDGGVKLKDNKKFAEELKKLCDKKVDIIIFGPIENNEIKPIHFTELESFGLVNIEAGKISFFNKNGFRIVEENNKRYEDIENLPDLEFLRFLTDENSFKTIFAAKKLEKAENEKGEIILKNKIDSSIFISEIDYLPPDDDEGVYKVDVSDYEFKEFKHVYQYIIEILEEARNCNSDIEWC